MDLYPKFIVHIQNLSNSKFPFLQKESLFIIEDYIVNKNGINILLKELSELDLDESMDLIKKFCSLPDYINIIYQDKPPILDLQQLFHIMLNDMFHLSTSKPSTHNLSICAHIIGSFFYKGHVVMICDTLNDILTKKEDFVIILSKILNHTSLNQFETVFVNLLVYIKSNNVLKFICSNFANPILETKFLFICQKMLFFQFYESDCVSINISLLVSKLPESDQITLLKELFVLWSNENSINKISWAQHFYLTKMILLLFFGLTNVIKDVFFIGDNLSLLLKGISLHLSQPIRNYSLIGMVVAEVLSKYCSYKADEPLNFEYVDTDETKVLKKLVNVDVSSRKFDEKVHNIQNKDVSDIESDDTDFEPIKTCFDNEKILVKRPFYLRDCFEGLRNTNVEAKEYFKNCLDSVENLFLSCPETSIEEALEFSKTLLHLYVEYELEYFTDKQRNALVTLCCLAPIKISNYLSKEFFEERNGIGVKFTILHVIMKSAQKLSGFNDFLQTTNQIQARSQTKQPINNNAKTRYFFKRRDHPIVETQNLFNECANNFFFPLINGVNRSCGFDVLTYDDDLLARFVYTLGIVVFCSVHFISFGSMLKEYLLFLKSLRTHDRVCVRRSVQVCLGICFIGLSGASSTCFDDLVEYLMDWQIWLRTANEIPIFELDADCSSLIEKNLFLLRDLAVKSISVLMPN